jgi:Holliday junction resolvase RusA-like endonuclease
MNVVPVISHDAAVGRVRRAAQTNTTSGLAVVRPQSDPGADVVGVCKAVGEGSPPSSAVILLELPTPPSVNQLYRNKRGHGRVKTQVYQDWQGHAGWRLKLQNPGHIAGPVIIVVNIERTNNAADVDNRIKATFDLLVTHRVIEDDSRVAAFCAAWAKPASGIMRLAILPASNLTTKFQLAPDGRHGGWFFDAPQLEQEPA